MNQSATIIKYNDETSEVSSNHFNQKQIDILKNSICKGASNEEFEMFLMACQKTKLDPFMRQIYAVKRKVKKPDGSWGESMTIQTGIDGYRLIAERTEKYVPGPEPTYTLDKNGNLVSATAYIKKLTKDGTWHIISASAYFDEYCQTFIDRQTGEKKPTGMWVNMPKTMLAKCAEAQALRKAFPAEMAGVYTKEEMTQADISEIIDSNVKPLYIEKKEEEKINSKQYLELNKMLEECGAEYKEYFLGTILNRNFKIEALSDLPLKHYDSVKSAFEKKREENRERIIPKEEITSMDELVEVAQ